MWISEFNEINNNSGDFKKLLSIFKSKDYIKRIFVFTNRQNGEVWNLPNASLVENGTLTEKGNLFVNLR